MSIEAVTSDYIEDTSVDDIIRDLRKQLIDRDIELARLRALLREARDALSRATALLVAFEGRTRSLM